MGMPFVFFFWLNMQTIQSYLQLQELAIRTFVWTKDTIKSSGAEFINNYEVILVCSDDEKNLVPQIPTFPYNSKSINVRPTKKWKNEDGVHFLVSFLSHSTGGYQLHSEAEKAVESPFGHARSCFRPSYCSS
jgi:hypothetical protein